MPNAGPNKYTALISTHKMYEKKTMLTNNAKIIQKLAFSLSRRLKSFTHTNTDIHPREKKKILLCFALHFQNNVDAGSTFGYNNLSIAGVCYNGI